MAGASLPGTDVRVRRGRRTDLPRVRAVLGLGAGDHVKRLYRRVIADLGTDLYVAEDAAGEIVGLVSVVYGRSLLRGGLCATLDGARAQARPVLDGLLAFVEGRARRRGCRRLEARVDAGDPDLRAALLARGYHAGEALVAELAGLT